MVSIATRDTPPRNISTPSRGSATPRCIVARSGLTLFVTIDQVCPVAIDRAATLRNAEKLLRTGKLEPAIAEYLRVVEAQPRDWNTSNTLGDLYVKANQTD